MCLCWCRYLDWCFVISSMIARCLLFAGDQNQSLVDAHTEALQKVIEEYDKKVGKLSREETFSVHYLAIKFPQRSALRVK